MTQVSVLQARGLVPFAEVVAVVGEVLECRRHCPVVVWRLLVITVDGRRRVVSVQLAADEEHVAVDVGTTRLLVIVIVAAAADDAAVIRPSLRLQINATFIAVLQPKNGVATT